jgi:hypothetical protein
VDERFLVAWNAWIYKLAPLIKDENWSAEDECRLVHENDDISEVNFAQKRTMLARYVDLAFPNSAPLVPIRYVLIGPGNDPGLTKANVELLLKKKGYPPTATIEITKVSLRNP